MDLLFGFSVFVALGLALCPWRANLPLPKKIQHGFARLIGNSSVAQFGALTEDTPALYNFLRQNYWATVMVYAILRVLWIIVLIFVCCHLTPVLLGMLLSKMRDTVSNIMTATHTHTHTHTRTAVPNTHTIMGVAITTTRL
jgi:hypothetical protein